MVMKRCIYVMINSNHIAFPRINRFVYSLDNSFHSFNYQFEATYLSTLIRWPRATVFHSSINMQHISRVIAFYSCFACVFQPFEEFALLCQYKCRTIFRQSIYNEKCLKLFALLISILYFKSALVELGKCRIKREN